MVLVDFSFQKPPPTHISDIRYDGNKGEGSLLRAKDGFAVQLLLTSPNTYDWASFIAFAVTQESIESDETFHRVVLRYTDERQRCDGIISQYKPIRTDVPTICSFTDVKVSKYKLPETEKLMKARNDYLRKNFRLLQYNTLAPDTKPYPSEASFGIAVYALLQSNDGTHETVGPLYSPVIRNLKFKPQILSVKPKNTFPSTGGDAILLCLNLIKRQEDVKVEFFEPDTRWCFRVSVTRQHCTAAVTLKVPAYWQTCFQGNKTVRARLSCEDDYSNFVDIVYYGLPRQQKAKRKVQGLPQQSQGVNVGATNTKPWTILSPTTNRTSPAISTNSHLNQKESNEPLMDMCVSAQANQLDGREQIPGFLSDDTSSEEWRTLFGTGNAVSDSGMDGMPSNGVDNTPFNDLDGMLSNGVNGTPSNGVDGTPSHGVDGTPSHEDMLQSLDIDWLPSPLEELTTDYGDQMEGQACLPGDQMAGQACLPGDQTAGQACLPLQIPELTVGNQGSGNVGVDRQPTAAEVDSDSDEYFSLDGSELPWETS